MFAVISSLRTMNSNLLIYGFRILNLTAGIFFFICAYVQHNDPDATFWIFMYAIPGFMSLTVAIKHGYTEWKVLKYIDMCINFVATIASARTLHQHFDTVENFFLWLIHDENGREFGGLFIVTVWTTFMHEYSHIKFKVFGALVFIGLPICIWVFVYFNSEFRRHWPKHCQSALYPDLSSTPKF